MTTIEVFAVVDVHDLRVFQVYKLRSNAQGQATRLNNQYSKNEWVVVACYGKVGTK